MPRFNFHFRTRCGHQPTSPSTCLTAPASAPDVEEWWQIRRKNIQAMRRHTRMVLFLMACIEAMRIGPVELVYAGKHDYPAPGPEDYGLSYCVSYFLCWIYVCMFMVVWVPVFSWWVPESTPSEDDSSLNKFVGFLKDLNMVLLPGAIGFSAGQYLYYAIHSLIYVDARPVGSSKFPKNTRKNWLVRFFLVGGMVSMVLFGDYALSILAMTDLAHVKKVEYYIVIVPSMINFGMVLGTVAQRKMEKRIARKIALANIEAVERNMEEAADVEEKQALLDA